MPQQPSSLEWVIHPARDSPPRAVFALTVVALSTLLAGEAAGPLVALMAFLFLIAAVAPFMLATRFVLDEQGAELHRAWVVRRRDWQDFRRWAGSGRFVLLSPFSRPNLLDRTRGMLLDLHGAPAGARAWIEDKLGSGAAE